MVDRFVCCKSLLLVVGLGLSGAAFAETLFGIYAGAGRWQQDSSGDITANGTPVDVGDDLDLGSSNDNVLWVAFEHPVPVIPNVRIQQSAADLTGSSVLSRNVVFNGVSFVAQGAVESQVDFKVQDAILYYNLLDGVFNLDAGLAVRRLEGHAQISSVGQFAEVDFNGTLPMVYARAEWELPFGFWVGGGGEYIKFRRDSFIDVDAVLGWKSEWGFGVEGGMRYIKLKVDDLGDVDQGSLTVDGPYAALNYRF
jgi:outer membrane protein